MAGGLALGLAAGVALMLRRPPPTEPPRTALRASIMPPPGALFLGYGAIAISPDGRRLAFRALSEDGRDRIWVRPLDSPTARPIEGTDASLSPDATAPNPFPFWSPDGRWLGFLADGSVKKVDLAGGRPMTICAVPGLRGASWGLGDVILLGALRSPILRVSAAGNTGARHRRWHRRGAHLSVLPPRWTALSLPVGKWRRPPTRRGLARFAAAQDTAFSPGAGRSTRRPDTSSTMARKA